MSDPARWISVGELAEAFGPDSYTPPPTADLAGSAHTLHFEDGRAMEYRFLSGSRLAWTLGGEADGPRAGEAEYFALEVRATASTSSTSSPASAPPTAVSLVLDLAAGIATTLVARLPGSAGRRASRSRPASRGATS